MLFKRCSGAMLGFRCQAITLARSFARCCSNVAPAIIDANHGAEKTVNRVNLTVSYLVDSCGFTQKAATIAAQKVNLKSTEKADKVLSLFREYGFKEGELSRLLEKCPRLIVGKPERLLRPKLDLLASLGPSQDFLVKTLIGCPQILYKSLKKTLVPSLEFLRKMLGTDENVLKVMRRQNRLLCYKLPCFLERSVAILQEVGMTDDLILAFLKDRPTAFLTSAARLRVLVDRAREIGFDPKRYGFIDAMGAFAATSDKTWEQKVELLKRWGWSDDEVVYAFKKSPAFMMMSEKKINAVLDYFVNTNKLNPSFVVKYPWLVTFSLEKRIIPRCSTIQYLLSKGVLGMEDITLNRVLCESENTFFRKFVMKYEKTHPELLELYTQYKNGAVSGMCQPLCSHDSFKHSNNIQLDG